MIRENFVILIKRKKLSNTLHIAPDGEFMFWELIIRKTLKESVADMGEHTVYT